MNLGVAILIILSVIAVVLGAAAFKKHLENQQKRAENERLQREIAHAEKERLKKESLQKVREEIRRESLLTKPSTIIKSEKTGTSGTAQFSKIQTFSTSSNRKSISEKQKEISKKVNNYSRNSVIKDKIQSRRSENDNNDFFSPTNPIGLFGISQTQETTSSSTRDTYCPPPSHHTPDPTPSYDPPSSGSDYSGGGSFGCD